MAINPDKILNLQGETIRWYRRESLEAGTELPAEQAAIALWDLKRAEKRGFSGCQAVFVNFKYDGLDEALSETSRNNGKSWGRGQHVTYRHFVDAAGILQLDPSFPKPPPSWKGTIEGYPCEIRINFQGARCGYVTVPSRHPICNKDLSSIDYRVHGGLTYGKAVEGGWKFGFDCSHAGDACHPEFIAGVGSLRYEGEYRSEEYVIEEIKKLAAHLKAMEAAEKIKI